jgi:sortase A
MRKKTSAITTILLIIILLVGLSVMLYPTISDWWNSKTQSRMISDYSQTVEALDDDTTELLWQQAVNYNTLLANLSSPFTNCDSIPNYDDILNVSGTGVMGYITIPVIHVELPIYHNTSEEVLNIAAGHLKGTSFPVGGSSTHAVISAHRGLPTSKLFTDIDQLVVGDTFTITILNHVLTYEVEEIRIILPDEVENLYIEPGRDMVTLMTCTPYGINSHRLLVRSKRIDTKYQSHATVSADASQLDTLLVVPCLSAPLLVLLLIYWGISSKQRKRHLPDGNLLDVFEKKLP